jgi:phosphate:Na+ symporter
MVAFAVAIFHTCFNFLNLCLLIPFTNQIASLVTKWVKDKPEGEDAPIIQYISQNLVDLGELNIVEADSALKTFSAHCIKMFDGYIEVFDNPEQDMSLLVIKLKSMEDDADEMMHDITNYLVRCTSHDLSAEHAEKITGMLRITAELEECSDAIYRLVKLAERKYTTGRRFSPEQTANIKLFTDHIGEFLKYTHDNMLKESDGTIVTSFNAKAASMRSDFNKAAMKRMKEGKVKLEMLNINTNNELRGIANQLSHIVITSSEIAD